MSWTVTMINPDDPAAPDVTATVYVDAPTFIRNLTGIGWQYVADGPNGERGYMHPDTRVMISIPGSVLAE